MASTSCKSCSDSGRCSKCKGVGSFTASDGPHSRNPCTTCHCTGRCPVCDGKSALTAKRIATAKA
jgi:hypothetical protein